MSEIRITTNHHARDVVYAHELTADERAQFDYLDWEAIEEGRDSADFVRYRGELLYLNDFLTTSGLGAPEAFRGWDGYAPDSFFSGLLVRYPRESFGAYGEEIDTEHVVIARYCS
jgi:hypothetical protein